MFPRLRDSPSRSEPISVDSSKEVESCAISDEKERERDREASSSPAASKLVVLTGEIKVQNNA